MQEHGLSRKEIALKLDVPYKTAQCWFAKGKSHYDPSTENQLKIKRFLHPETHPTFDVVDLQQPDTNSTPSERSVNMASPTAKLRNKTLRDPIQLDIELTPLEIRVIDTPAFNGMLRRLDTDPGYGKNPEAWWEHQY